MTPAETLILDEVEARLRGITKANGYALDIKSVERGKLTPFKPGDIPAINIWPTAHARENTTYGLDQHTLRVVVDIRDSELDVNFPDAAAVMLADAITGVNRAPAFPKVSDPIEENLSETVSSLQMVYSSYQIGPGQKPWIGAMVELEIIYDSQPGDMFNYQP